MILEHPAALDTHKVEDNSYRNWKVALFKAGKATESVTTLYLPDIICPQLKRGNNQLFRKNKIM